VALSLALGSAVLVLQTGTRMMAPIGLALALWLVLGAVADIGARIRLGKVPFVDSLRRYANLPRSDHGKMLAHAGLGIMVFGIASITAWESEDNRVTQVGETYAIYGPRTDYDIRFEELREFNGPNYSVVQGVFSVLVDGELIATLRPEKRIYPLAQMPTTEAAMDIGFTRDIYIVLGDPQEDGGFAVRSYVKPFVNWIWGGTVVMALGGLLSLSDRRFRVAAGSRRRRREQQMAPAE
jgi:cytochrome c-type biogenesis protein CcmF